MKKLLLLLLLLSNYSFSLELQKAQTYDGTQNINNWLMSEKLDGIRAYWNGREFKTKKGNTIYAPSWFTKDFPPFELDGELWSKQMDFENIQSIVLTQKPHDRWKELTYHIFEVPNAKGNFTQRLKKAQSWFLNQNNPYVKIIPQKVCSNAQELETFLNEVIKQKGEGVMLKNPNYEYKQGLTTSLLKVKTFDDMEGTVIGHNVGTHPIWPACAFILGHLTHDDLAS